MKTADIVLTTYTSENLNTLMKKGWMIEFISHPVRQKIEQHMAQIVRRELDVFGTDGCLRHLVCIEDGWGLGGVIVAKNWLGFQPAISYLRTPLQDNLGENTAVVVLWPTQTYPSDLYHQHAAVAYRRQPKEPS